MRVALFLSQFALALTWVVYVAYLPELLAAAGIGKKWLLPILIVDQLLFAAADVFCGFALDRAERWLKRAVWWVAAAVVLSALLFMMLPVLAPQAPAPVLLAVLFAWVVFSSAARVPPIVLLAKATTPSKMSTPIALYLLGVGVAAAAAPYLAVLLKGVAPALPFAAASLALVISIVWVARAAKAQAHLVVTAEARPTHAQATTARTEWPIAMLLAAILAATAVQIHTALNSAALYRAALPQVALHWLMPLFWAGFSLAMLPATLWLQQGARGLSTAALVVGGVSFAITWASPTPSVLVAAQIIAGAAWGAVFLLLLDRAQRQGREGSEGRVVGATLAMLALAAAARIGIALLLARGVAIDGRWLSALPFVAWVVAATLMVLSVRRVD